MQLNLILAVCAPILCSAKIMATSFNASFDNLAADPLTSQGNPIEPPYDGLAYPGFTARANGVSIIRAHSPNNSASSNQLNQQLAGNMSMITVNYTGSKISYFDLDSTYLACGVTTQVSVGLPQACTVQFNGTTSSGKTVIETCSYAGTALAPAMVLCDFSTLKSVKAVSLIPTETSTLSTTTVIFLDNIVGIYYSKS